MPPDVSIKEFLTAIWGEQQGICGLAMGRPDPQNPEKTKGFWEKPFAYPEELDKLLAEIPKQIGKLNIYYGVCLKKERWPRKTGRKNDDGTDEVEKRGTKENALSANAIWADIDYKDTPQPEAIKRLKAFPLKTSIGVLSGGGIQAFWLLKEPATGEELKRVERINAALSRVLGGDHTQDTARVLRMPFTKNVKYVPSRDAVLAPGTWRPHLKYTLDDIENLLPVEFLNASTVPMSNIPATQAPAPGTTSPVDVNTLPVSDTIKKIIREGLPAFIDFRKQTDPPEKFADRQRRHQLSRSEADAYAITGLVYANLSDSDIYAIFRDPKNQVGEKYREKKDGDKYLGSTIQKAKKFKEQHPRTEQDRLAERVGKALEREHGDRGMEVVKIIKWDYEEPVWDVITKTLETEELRTTRCKHEEFAQFVFFKKKYLAQHNHYPPFMKQPSWEAMVNRAEVEIQKVEKEVGTTEGEIQEALDEWLAEAQSESNEATIQYLPVYSAEEGKVYLRLPAFMQYLTSQKIDVRRKEVTRILKIAKFDRSTQKFGRKPMKVWAGPYGNGTNGTAVPIDPKKPHPSEPKAPEVAPEPSLFPEPGSDLDESITSPMDIPELPDVPMSDVDVEVTPFE